MINNTPSLDLVEFIETQILPRYAAFDRAHNMEHVTRVIRSSLELSRLTGADINMVYTIAAYHDLGMSGHRADHHIRGGKILTADARLKKWFSPDQIKIMKEAVEDHRASASRAPRSIYGKIVAEADSATTRSLTRKGIGSVSRSTCTASTPRTATSVCGFPTHPMPRGSMSYAPLLRPLTNCARPSTVCLRKRLLLLHEMQVVDDSQCHDQHQQHHRLDHTRGHLLHNEEGHHQCHQRENIITYITHHLNIFLNSVGTGVSNSIGSPVTG